MDDLKSGVRTSSFKLIAGFLGGGGVASMATPERMELFTNFLQAIPLGAYIVFGVYIIYRMEIEKAKAAARKNEPTTAQETNETALGVS